MSTCKHMEVQYIYSNQVEPHWEPVEAQGEHVETHSDHVVMHDEQM